MKMIMEAAMESQKQTNKTNQRHNSFSSLNDELVAKSAKESAKVNKALFDEHVKIGFSEEQALEIVTSLISRKK